MLAISSQTFYAEEEEENYGFEPDNCDRVTLSLNAPLSGFSSSYDPRNLGIDTPTKNQSPYLLCWMFATTGAIEQYASLKYGSKFDISELHGAYARSDSTILPETNSTSGYYNINYNNGGKICQALQYYSNWNEPVFFSENCHWESAVAETSNSFIDTNNKITQSFQNADSVLNITDALYLNNDSDSIKKAIIDYGGVITSINYRKYKGLTQNGNNNDAYFFSSEHTDPNHSVVIVGWDDYYSTENFNKDGRKPNSNGAWLVRNSHSTNNSYFWLSYEEGSLFHFKSKKICITGIKKPSKSEKMLSYDYKELGGGFSRNTMYFCNVYDTSEYLDNYNEITKVMMYISSTGCNYEIRVIPLSAEDNLPNNINDYSVQATGYCNFEGYITKELNYPVDISNADKCAIIIKMTPLNENCLIGYLHEINGYLNNSGRSFSGIENNSSISWIDRFSPDHTNTGNLCIRPVLHNSNYVADDVTISPTQVVPTNSDVTVK